MNLKNCINRMNWKKVKGQTPPIRYIRDKITKITHDFSYGAKWSKENRATDTVKQPAVRFSLDYGRSPHVRARARGQTSPYTIYTRQNHENHARFSIFYNLEQKGLNFI